MIIFSWVLLVISIVMISKHLITKTIGPTIILYVVCGATAFNDLFKIMNDELMSVVASVVLIYFGSLMIKSTTSKMERCIWHIYCGFMMMSLIINFYLLFK